MATSSYYGRMRATDADRDNVHAVLKSAYADGRLTWDEFDTRSTMLVEAKTYDQLACLTTDLQRPVPYQPQRFPVLPGQGRTNPLAACSLAFGIGQIFLPFLGAVVAVVCGHLARRQIRKDGDQGDAMAVAGLVLGYIGVAIPLLIVAIIAIGVAAGPGG
jgi:Domain of unknown function (DUF1707)/Domain of unknown function (DUF4190)